MFKNAAYWRDRCAAAEAHVAVLQATHEAAMESLKGAQLLIRDQAVLISITRDKRRVRFLFTRNGELHQIEMIGTWDDDVEGWTKALLSDRISEKGMTNG